MSYLPSEMMQMAELDSNDPLCFRAMDIVKFWVTKCWPDFREPEVEDALTAFFMTCSMLKSEHF